MSFFKSIFSAEKAKPSVEAKAAVTSKAAQAADSEKPALELSAENVITGSVLESKYDAIRLIAEKMLALGYVSASYYDALVAREEKVSTYLTNGVSIPHGVNEAKELVIKTGVVVLQIPQGVLWNENGDIAHLIVGIAASGDDHLTLLQNLTEVVMDKERAEHLGTDASRTEIIENLLKKKLPEAEDDTAVEDYAITQSTHVTDEHGIHARPANKLIEIIKSYSEISIQFRRGGKAVNAKSFPAILSLGLKKDDVVVVSAEGQGAEECVSKVVAAIAEGLDDPETSADTIVIAEHQKLTTARGKAVLTGVVAAPGIAIAPPFYLQTEPDSTPDAGAATNVDELTRFKSAVAKAVTELAEIRDKLAATNEGEAAIFSAQLELLADQEIQENAMAAMAEGKGAEEAWTGAIDAQIEVLLAVEDERIRARAADFQDVKQRVFNLLLGKSNSIKFPEDPFILLAKDLTPSQTASLHDAPVKALCTELGGPNSHMAILARALGIPAVVGIAGLSDQASDSGADIICDANGGQLVFGPDPVTTAHAIEILKIQTQEKEKAFASRNEPAVTIDGTRIEVVANIASAADAKSAIESGAEGVGLLRTEFLFEDKEAEPSVAMQVQELQAILDALDGKPIIIRTIDIGGDKPVKWLDMPKEDNPFLGVRGIRLCRKFESTFRNQLRAIYQIAKDSEDRGHSANIHVMFPMISRISEWEWSKGIADEIRAELSAPSLPLGIMIEVPSAVLIADHFAKRVDFFSIGSNDLTQYTLAVDRLNAELAFERDNYNPALIRSIGMAATEAKKQGKWVGVCGNMASNPKVASMLIGLGVTELSVSPSAIPEVKKFIRDMSYEQSVVDVNKALDMPSSTEIKEFYDELY